MAAKDQPKEFSLKPIETQVLSGFQQSHMVMLANLLSFIALERLAYPVSEQTQFSLNADGTKLTISETQPAVQPAEPSATAKALKEAK